MKLKKTKKFKTSVKKNTIQWKTKLLFFALLLFFLTYLFLQNINYKLRPKIENIIETTVNKKVYSYIFSMFSKDTLENENLMDIIYLQKNEKGEIVSVDYRFNKAYEYLSDSMVSLYDHIGNVEFDVAYFDKDKNVFFIPSGMATNNLLLENMGFKIPCKVELLSDTSMGFKTKVSNYGINNILVELYLVIQVKNNIFIPNTSSQFGNTYEIVLASKIVMGEVPAYYGDTIEKMSTIVSS